MSSVLAALGATILGCGSGGNSGPVNVPPPPGTTSPPAPKATPTKAYIREAFKFEYPASWTVDVKGKDYDPDHVFSIDEPGRRAMILFVIYDAEKDAATLLAKLEKAHEKTIHGATRTEFNHWGRYEGVGVALQGKVQGVVKTTVRLFAFNAGKKTFLLTENLPDELRQQLAPDFQMIEQSFHVTN